MSSELDMALRQYLRCMESVRKVNVLIEAGVKNADDLSAINREVGFIRTMAPKLRQYHYDMVEIEAVLRRTQQ